MQKPAPAPLSPRPRRLTHSSLCSSLSIDLTTGMSSLPPVPLSPRPRRLTHSSLCKSQSMEFPAAVPSFIPVATSVGLSPQLSPLVSRKRSSSTTPYHRENRTASNSPEQGSDNMDMRSAISFSQIAECHSNDLPLQVKVSGSLYGVCGTASLVDSETINLYFVKETKCVRVMVAENRELKVPINSSLEFSPLYKPTEDLTDAMEGREFVSVNDLMSANPLPLVVSVTEQHDPSSQLVTGDILVLKKMRKKAFGSDYLVCHSIQQNQEVRLTEKLRAQFSTRPHLVRLRLPKLIEHIKLPQKVIVSNSDEHQWSQLRSSFPNNMCTLLSSTMDISFIASYSKKEISSVLMEIPTTFSFPVHIKPISAEAKQQLLDETRDLLKEFQPKMVSTYVSERMSSKSELRLRKCVCEDDWKEGVILRKPDSVEETENPYEYLPFVRCNESVDAKEEELLALKKLVHDLQEKVKMLEVHNSTEEAEDNYIVMKSPQSNISDNKQSLGLLNCSQVLQLLDAMKLGQYKPKFESEQIDGDLMLELDDSILEHELGVKTRIHRIKLMKVITGIYPVKQYMKQDEEQ